MLQFLGNLYLNRNNFCFQSAREKNIHKFSLFQCRLSIAVEGDGIDNDCDGYIDEERRDRKDNDGDGLIDEDIALVTT